MLVLKGGFWNTLSNPPPSPPVAEEFGGTVCTLDSECANTARCIGGRCSVPKNRYVSIDANPENAGKVTARRVVLDTNANGAFDVDIDVPLGWMGEPFSVTLTGPEPSPQWQSHVTGTPFFLDWTTVGAGNETVHFGDCHFSPGRAYVVQGIFEGQDISVESNYSDPLGLPTTGLWGDVAGGGNPAAPPDNTVNVGDIQAIVLGFQAAQSAPKVWLDLEGLGSPDNVADFSTINIADVLRAVQGFLSIAYPYSDPCTCAGLAPCS